MPLVLSVVKDEAEFANIAAMDHEGWKSPPNPQLKHFRPNLPNRTDAINYVINRSTNSFRTHDPNKKWWLKVVDTENLDGEYGGVVGTATWEVNEMKEAEGEEGEEGGTNTKKTQAIWHPEGSVEREFAERFIDGLWGFLGRRCTRPHMDLLSIVVIQSHRKRGVARQLIRWGTDKADELGIETVVSSLPSARGAYERCGLGCIELIPADVDVENPSERWKELQNDDLTGWLMWRPIGRDFVVGKDKAPWLE